MSGENNEMAAKLPSFNFVKSDWSFWKAKFLAGAGRKEYKDLLLGSKPIPNGMKADGSIDPNWTPNDDEKKVLKKAELALEEIFVSIDTTKHAGKTASNLVKNESDCKVAWEKLLRKFEPTTAPSRISMKNQYHTARLKKGHCPMTYITYLEDLKTRLGDMGVDKCFREIALLQDRPFAC